MTDQPPRRPRDEARAQPEIFPPGTPIRPRRPDAFDDVRFTQRVTITRLGPFSTILLVAALAIVVVAILALVTVGPPVLMLIGLSLQNAGPKHPSDLAIVVVRILASGTMLAVFYTSISMAVASLTDRRAFAAAFTLILVAGSVTVASRPRAS